MASEGQRQQDLINSGFLDNLGSKDPGLQLDTVEQVFVKYMGKLVQRLTDRIDQAGPDGREISATGNLSSNIRFEYTKSATRYVGQIFMPDYADFVDKGVRGLGGDNRNTTSPYRFRFLRPSKKHVAAIEQWIKDKNNLAIVTAPKGLTDIAAQQKSLAYIFAASARRKGLKATNFKRGVLDDIMPDFARDIGKAMGKDIAVSIRLTKLQ
jgi:hypothetical protein